MVQNTAAYCHGNFKQSNTKRQANGATGWKTERESEHEQNVSEPLQVVFNPSKIAWEITSYNLELLSRQVVIS